MKHLVLVMLIRMTAASLFLYYSYCSYNIEYNIEYNSIYQYQKYTYTLTLTTVNYCPLCELSKWMILPSNGRITYKELAVALLVVILITISKSTNVTGRTQ